jgi:hypothetical protein
MPKSKTPRSTAKKMVARTTASGAQQYTRGKDAYERMETVRRAIPAAKTEKGRQALLKAKRDEMTPGARAIYAQYKEQTKRSDLSRGTALASGLAKIEAKYASAKSRKK